MRERFKSAFAVVIIFSMIMSFAACGNSEPTEKVPDAPITSSWDFVSMKLNDDLVTKADWIEVNESDPANAVPVPTFSSADGESCVLNYNNADRAGKLSVQPDGGYVISFDDAKAALVARVTGNELTITYRGESKLELTFRAVS
ncbi:hypothetical protein SAMN02910456_00163 [Ruminococcaceae bacterium YRB3002]|nr:hypothetical protein SAMN02910456_00163 [Ruminococcaceae bacterium YRB3002]